MGLVMKERSLVLAYELCTCFIGLCQGPRTSKIRCRGKSNTVQFI